MAVMALFVLAMLAICWRAPDFAQAIETQDGHIGVIHIGAENYYFKTYGELKSKLEAQKGKTVTVEMYCDWDWKYMTSRLVIPENSRVTIEMHGCVMDRQLAAFHNKKDDGEIIVVRSGAMLTINGRPDERPADDRTYPAFVFDSTDAHLEDMHALPGGLITGGDSTNGAGGIHVKKGATVTLNDVTVAGNRAQKGSAAKAGSVSCGYGGGLYLEGGDITVNLNNSTVMGNYASEDGGGIYADSGGAVSVNMVNSHIDSNFAHSDGGGIGFDGRKFAIVADGTLDDHGVVTGSTISNNQCVERGGGIMANAGGLTVRQMVMQDNQAARGGAIYDAQDSATLDRLDIRNNTATDKGGGIFFYPFLHTTFGYTGDSSIKDCTITNNSAGAQGGGVFVDDCTNLNENRKRIFAGATVINGNTGGNLVIECSEWRSKSETFGLTAGADVHVSFQERKVDKRRTSPLEDANCAQYVHSDQDGYQLIFDVDQRFIDWVDDAHAPEVATIVTVPSDDANDASQAGKQGSRTEAVSGKIGTVGPGGGSGSDYNLIRGFASHNNKEELSAFYYSDALFDADPTKYNEHLATLSLTFAYCGGYMTNAADEVAGNTYYNKHWGARQFLADIGCPDQNIYVSDNMLVKPGTDSIGVSIGSKELAKADGAKTGYILIPVAVRGFGYEAEWASNVTLGSAAEMGEGKEAKGFSNAADQVFAEVKYYLKKYNLEEAYKAGKVKFWVTGYSRAGATANLTSKRLVEMIAADGCDSQVFGYTCEAPQGGTDVAEQLGDKTKYYCIHNMVNKVDIVPYVAPVQMGFKRYGVDHYIPGTAAADTVKRTVKNVDKGGSSGPTQVTTYADNAVTYTKSFDYDEQRTLMRKHLLALSPGMVFYDYFSPMALDFVSTSGFLHKYYDGGPEGNHIEDFVEDFIWLLVQKSNISRDKYVTAYKLAGKTFSSIQGAARDLMKISKMGSGLDGVIDDAGSLAGDIPYFSVFTLFTGSLFVNSADFSMAGLYFNVVGEWGTLSESDKAIWTQNLWNAFKKTGALDKLSKEEQAQFEAAFPTLLDVALTVVDSDYNYKPVNNKNNQWAKRSSNSMMYLPTFIEYADYILKCHDPNLNIAWAESYDSWYAGEINNFKLAQPASVGAPGAYGFVNGERQVLTEGTDSPNRLPGDQRILLENESIVGEAVYYDLIDVTDGNKPLATNQLYRGGIDLVRGSAAAKTYKIVAYDMSYGVKSGETATYIVTLYDNKHKVTVVDLTGSGTGGTQAGGQNAPSGQGSSDDGLDLTTGSVPDGVLTGSASAEGEPRERSYTFAEGQNVVVQADEPSSKFFKVWKAEVLKDGGWVDVTNSLLDAGKTNVAASFQMPGVDALTYLDGYELKLTAQYGERITTATAAPIAPVAGQPLASTVTVTFDGGRSGTYTPTWTYAYTDEGGAKHTVPASGNAYGNTAYFASIHIPDDQAHDIMFASQVSVSSSAGTVVSSPVNRSVDGDITIDIGFETGAGGDTRPDVPIAFTVNEIDLNTGGQDPEADPLVYRTHAGSQVTLTAPHVPNEVFVMWDFGDSGIVVSDEDKFNETVAFTIPSNASTGITISALYVPVVQNVDVNLSKVDGSPSEPEGGKPGPARYVASATISNEYEIDPRCLELTWAPGLSDGAFGYGAQYTASVRIKYLEGSQKIAVRKAGETGAYTPVNFVLVPAANMEVSFNGSTDDVSLDLLTLTASRTFPQTNYALAAVKQPDNINDVAYADGQESSQIKAMLPATTKILMKGGAEFDAPIEWGEPSGERTGPDSYSGMVWTVTGTVQLPSNVDNPDNVNLAVPMVVTVDDAGTAPSPTVSPDPGTYVYNQVATFDVRRGGGAIWYTTDGSDPSDESNGSRKEFHPGDEIYVNRAAANQRDAETGYRLFVVKAYTEVEGKRPSNVAEFDYVFFDVFIPEGAQLEYTGEEQVGVEGSPFYTLEILEGEGARIDEDGNAVATKPGVYKVRAHLNDSSDSWQTDGRGGRSQEDQIIVFSIGTFTVKFVNDDGTVLQSEELAYGVLPTYKGEVPKKAATGDVSYVFAGWTPEIAPVTGDATYTASYEEAAPEKKASLYFDFAGGTLDGKADLTIVANVGDEIEIPAAPVREGYTFKYWKGSEYRPGDRYKVEGDHKFTAVWGKVAAMPAANPSVSSRTGDATPLAPVAVLAILSAGVALVAYRKRQSG